MSEQLYRPAKADETATHILRPIGERFPEVGVVPAEPCRHDNYARHVISGAGYIRNDGTANTTFDEQWCDGAEIKEAE